MKVVFIGIAVWTAFTAQSQTFTIYFDFNKYNLHPEEKFLLDSFLTANRQYLPGGKVELTGHCDFIGSDGYNDQLSQRRVLTIKNYLEAYYNLSGKISTAIGYGEKKPVNTNKTAEDRQWNRRVEVSIIPGQVVSLKEKIADTATVAGTNIVLRNINFVGGRHVFLPESYPVLQELLDAMKTYPKLVIEIHGHICCQAYANDGLDLDMGTYNLSEERAKAVYEHLINNGIAPSRLSYQGFGHSMPIYPYPEQSEDQRRENRRVEIKIISK